jgi:hypothetical protein
MKHVRLDGRLAEHRAVDELARWWSQATEEARFRTLKASCEAQEGAPPLARLRLAIYLWEAESGQVEEG